MVVLRRMWRTFVILTLLFLNTGTLRHGVRLWVAPTYSAGRDGNNRTVSATRVDGGRVV